MPTADFRNRHRTADLGARAPCVLPAVRFGKTSHPCLPARTQEGRGSQGRGQAQPWERGSLWPAGGPLSRTCTQTVPTPVGLLPPPSPALHSWSPKSDTCPEKNAYSSNTGRTTSIFKRTHNILSVGLSPGDSLDPTKALRSTPRFFPNVQNSPESCGAELCKCSGILDRWSEEVPKEQDAGALVPLTDFPVTACMEILSHWRL